MNQRLAKPRETLLVEEEGIISASRTVGTRTPDRFTVLVANAKGGCGKTTVSTNLASYYAGRGHRVSLLDLDPQESTRVWLDQRQEGNAANIDAMRLAVDEHFSRSKLMQQVERAHSRLIIDSPAGLSGEALEAVLSVSQVVLVPVLPSPIDIRAATRFLQTLMLTRSHQRRPRRLAVLANRSRERTLMFARLEKFLQSLKIPYLASLRDTQMYVHAADQGKGIMELELPRVDPDLADWNRVVEWLEVQRQLIRTLPGQ